MEKLNFSDLELSEERNIVRKYIDKRRELKTFINGLFVFQWSGTYNKQFTSPFYMDNRSNPQIKCHLTGNVKSSTIKNRCMLSMHFSISKFCDHSDFKLKVALLNTNFQQLVLFQRNGDSSQKCLYLGEAPVDEFEKLYLHTNGNVKIIFEVVAKRLPTSHILDKSTQAGKELSECAKELEQSSDFLSLMMFGHFSDLIIVIGAEKIQAHRSILAARSPIFFEMFRKPENIKKPLEIEFQDVSFDGFRELLHWIYTGKTKNLNHKMAVEFLKLVMRFAVNSAVPHAQRLAIEHLQAENAIDLFAFADLHSLKNLRTTALEYIVDNIDVFDIWDLKHLESSLLAEVTIASYKRGK